jgi:hypothetical protein
MQINDFPDRISPMLVKELRQGLRARSFTGVFLALHIILGLILLSAGAGSTSDQAGSTISAIIFTFFSIAVLVVQPMRGITALSSEIKGNTIDMMVLTRLSAWRIITGKWFAIVSQSGLILITIIPYLILRYFFGGMNLVGEIVLFTLIFITSAALTAITVGLSASGSIILRSILPIFALPVGSYILLMILLFSPLRGSTIADFFALDTTESRISISLYVATFAYFGFFLLAIGTSLIAPYAENHSTLRRIVALIVTLIAVGLSSYYVTEPEMLALIYSIIFLPIFACSLTEFTSVVPPVYHKFTRLGPFGKLIAPALLPGWPSGLFFCLILSLIAAYPFISPVFTMTDTTAVAFSSIFGTLIFPAVIINLFKMKGPARVSSYVLFGVASSILTLVLGGVSQSMSNPGFLWLFVWLPSIPSFMAETSIDDDAALFASISCNILYITILLLLALRSYISNMRELKLASTSSN